MSTRTDRLHPLPATLSFDMQPALGLHALINNQLQEVWEGSEFILNCMAYGSPDITFTWYKDGVKVNFNDTTRDIWTQTVAEDTLGRRVSVLGLSEAKKPDSGRWTCSADDARRRRCRALRLTILRPPDIKLIPSTLTINKISGEYRWQVSSVAGTNTKGVTIWTPSPKDEACESEASHGLWWPNTSPGVYASAICPPGHNGESVRFCEPKSIQHRVKWIVLDFSGCVADSLNDIYEQFTKISYGYSWGNISHVAHQYGAYLRSLPAQPGEGTPKK